MFTAKRSRFEPQWFIIYKPDGRAWRVCHEHGITTRLNSLNNTNN